MLGYTKDEDYPENSTLESKVEKYATIAAFNEALAARQTGIEKTHLVALNNAFYAKFYHALMIPKVRGKDLTDPETKKIYARLTWWYEDTYTKIEALKMDTTISVYIR